MIGNWPETEFSTEFCGLRVALQHEAEDRHEHQQQREQREERVVGDQRRQVAGLVVAELLDHGHGIASQRVALLVRSKARTGPIRSMGGYPPRTRSCAPRARRVTAPASARRSRRGGAARGRAGSRVARRAGLKVMLRRRVPRAVGRRGLELVAAAARRAGRSSSPGGEARAQTAPPAAAERDPRVGAGRGAEEPLGPEGVRLGVDLGIVVDEVGAGQQRPPPRGSARRRSRPRAWSAAARRWAAPGAAAGSRVIVAVR